MKFLQIILIYFQVLSLKAQEICDNCDENLTDSVNYHKILSSNSIINELTKIVVNSDINQCKEELLLIGDGIRKQEVWAFKSE